MSEDLVEGRTRLARPLVLGAVALGLLGALPFLIRQAPGPPPATQTQIGSPAPEAEGTLVYSTFETTGRFDRQQRLWGLDLSSGDLIQGPIVPSVEELLAVDPAVGVALLVTQQAGIGVAYLVDELAEDVAPREVARGDVLALSAERDALLVGRVHRRGGGCHGRGYDVARVELATSERFELGVGCGRLLALAAVADEVLVCDARGRVPVVRALGAERPLVRGFALVSAAPNGDLLLADPEHASVRALGVWPESPTGPLFLWRGQKRAPAPLVADVRLFGERLVAWAGDGSAAVVSGIVGGDRGMYLVRDGVGRALFPPNTFPLRSAFSGAAFDPAGTVFAAAVGHVVVTTPTGVEPLALPADAPSPLGPILWLP
jgi:hypothetical protein